MHSPAPVIVGEVHQGESFQDRKGRQAESEILQFLQEKFMEQTGKIFVNQKIPQMMKVPDFIFPILNAAGEIRLVIIECKASAVMRRDGSNACNQDVFAQAREYRNIIQRIFKNQRDEIEIDTYAIFPQTTDENIFNDLRNSGRDGILWGNLSDLENWLEGSQLLPAHHPFYKKEMNYIYHPEKVFRDKKLKVYEQRETQNLRKFGGPIGFKGLAGTGKTILMADQLAKDALETGRDLLYITHNVNLVKFFIRTMEEKLGKRAKLEKTPLSQQEIETISLDNGSIIYFVNFDKFATRFLRGTLDINYELTGDDSIWNICKKNNIGASTNQRPSEKDFTQCRKEILTVLERFRFNIRSHHQLFDGVYIDEFQDCKIDRTRLDIVLMFTARNEEGKPNLVFSEDTLQSYLKWEQCQALNEIQREEDESGASLTDVRRSDVLTYTSLLGFKVIPRPLTTVYRTPQNLFEISLSLIRDGFRGDQYENLLNKLEFKNLGGRLEIMDEAEVEAKWKTSLSKYSPDEVMFITDTQGYHPRKTHNHLNCRGCEGSLVFIKLSDTFLENPNYLYTLMCRTKDQLVLIIRSPQDRKVLNELLEVGLKNKRVA